MTRTTPWGEPIEDELRLRDDGLSPLASSALTALMFLVLFLALGLREGIPLRAGLTMAAVLWALCTVADLVRRRQRVWITAGEVVVRTWHGTTVRLPRASIVHVLHLRAPGSTGGLVSLLDDQDVPLWSFWTTDWGDTCAATLLDVGRRSTVEDVVPEPDTENSRFPSTLTRRAGRAGRLLVHGVLVAFGLTCLVLALLVIVVDAAGA